MRSPREIAFRLRQEISNLRLAAIPPEPGVLAPSPLPGLPDPEKVAAAVRKTKYAEAVLAIAEEILSNKIPILGTVLNTGPDVHWRRDYLSGKETGIGYFRLIPYLDFERAGDHKVIWELSRHQHLVLLAQAWRIRPDPRYLKAIASSLESWWQQNPFQKSINWASALEVAFRALSWIWIYHLCGAEWDDDFKRRLLNSLSQHAYHLEPNLSYYFSPNTHLLGEAVVLSLIGTLFPQFPRSSHWKELGARVVFQESENQVQQDGTHFEQSSYYHVYALDFFLLHYLVAGQPDLSPKYLIRMAEFVHTLTGAGHAIPLIGDDDGGRLFHPYGTRDEFACATLATCSIHFNRPEWLRDPEDRFEQAAWWLGPPAFPEPKAAPDLPASQHFPQLGLVILNHENSQLILDAGPFARGGAGHSHSDSLQLLLRVYGVDVLVDAGTFTYVSDIRQRNWFRGSAAHNTIRVDSRDQAIPAGPFRWNEKPTVSLDQLLQEPGSVFAQARCAYAGITHRRQILWQFPDLLCVVDTVTTPSEGNLLEQFWHFGEAVQKLSSHTFRSQSGTQILFPEDPAPKLTLAEGGEHGWRSRALATKQPAPVVSQSTVSTSTQSRLCAVFDWSPQSETSRLIVTPEETSVLLQIVRASTTKVRFLENAFELTSR